MQLIFATKIAILRLLFCMTKIAPTISWPQKPKSMCFSCFAIVLLLSVKKVRRNMLRRHRRGMVPHKKSADFWLKKSKGDDAKKMILEFSLSQTAREHVELGDAWKQIDTKAQASTAAAGVFVGGVFVFVRTPALVLDSIERLFVCFVLLCLVLSTVFSVRGMLVRKIPMPRTGQQIFQEVERLWGDPSNELMGRYLGLVGDSIKDWARTNSAIVEALERKGRVVAWAQGALIVSAFAIVVLVAYSIFRK
ncbi:hypothetical protein [Niveibacterium terrae]|uniref:hypothetical protein n=1 Tax=Niveibacterium terrae TaxID=3373598 RepID=UPI003A93C5BA